MSHIKITIQSACILLMVSILGACAKKEVDYNRPEEWTRSVNKIWDGAGHSAFTDLIRFNDAFYCVFREASGHFGEGGKVRVIRSTDGEEWETVKVFELEPIITEPSPDFEFNGANQNMVISPHADFNYANNGQFTITAWVKMIEPTNVTTDGSAISYIVSNRNGGDGYDFGTHRGTATRMPSLFADIGAPYLRKRQNNNAFTYGEWTHVSYVYDGANVYGGGATPQVYFHQNGVRVPQVGSPAISTQANTYGNEIAVFSKPGNRNPGAGYGSYAAGAISSLRFWNKALTDAEIAADMDAEVSSSTPNLIAGYDFDKTTVQQQGNDYFVPDVTGRHPGKLRNYVAEETIVSYGDLRDPKLSITPDNRLMILMDGDYYIGASVSSRRPYVSFSDASGDNFSEPEAADVHYPTADGLSNGNFWIWRLTWNNAKSAAYGFDYMNPLTLFKTTDGKVFRSERRLAIDGSPNEVSIKFDKQDNMYALIRRESGTALGMLAVSPPPYENFTYHELDIRLGGPEFLFLDDQTLVMGTRGFTNSTTMHIVTTNLQGEVLKTIYLPSAGDASYPGMVIHDGYLWVSYYSSKSGKADIYMAKIPLEELKP